MLNEVKTLVNKKKVDISNSTLSPEEKETELRKLKNLENILQDEQCFFKIDISTALSCLFYLGIEEERLMDFYKKLIAPSEYRVPKDVYELVDEEKQI